MAGALPGAVLAPGALTGALICAETRFAPASRQSSAAPKVILRNFIFSVHPPEQSRPARKNVRCDDETPAAGKRCGSSEPQSKGRDPIERGIDGSEGKPFPLIGVAGLLPVCEAT